MSIATAARGLLVLSLALAAFAQTDSAEVTRLEAENSLLEQKLIRATALRDLAATSAPKITGGLEGATNFSGETPAEAVQLAYQSLAKIAGLIAADLQGCDGPGDRIMIFNAAEISAFENLSAFRFQSKILYDYLAQALAEEKKITPPADDQVKSLFVLPMMVGPLIQSIIDVTKLFRVDREIGNYDVTPDEKAFIAILANRIANPTKDGKPARNCRVFYPELVPAFLFKDLSFTTDKELEKPGTSPSLSDWVKLVTDKTTKVRDKRLAWTKEHATQDEKIEGEETHLKKERALAATIGPLTTLVAELEAKLKNAKTTEKEAIQSELDSKKKGLGAAQAAEKELGTLQSKLNTRKNYSAQLAELLKLLTAALEAGDSYRASLLKDAGEGLTLISRLARSSRLEDELKCSMSPGCNSSILHVSIQKLTGSTLKKSNAFTGTRHTYSSGAIATFLQFGLWDATGPVNGAILKSGTYTGYSGQYKPESEKTIATIESGKL